MTGEPLDAPEDLPKEGPGQVTLGKLEHEVPRMPDQVRHVDGTLTSTSRLRKAGRGAPAEGPPLGPSSRSKTGPYRSD
jgi:hypothetical protein